MKETGIFYLAKLLSFFFGIYGCFFLHSSLHVPVVVSAASIGLLGSFFPSHLRFKHHIQSAIYAGAFAGMCSYDIVSSVYDLMLMSIIGAALYTALRNVLIGIGGKLGAIAFVSVASVILTKAIMF